MIPVKKRAFFVLFFTTKETEIFAELIVFFAVKCVFLRIKVFEVEYNGKSEQIFSMLKNNVKICFLS